MLASELITSVSTTLQDSGNVRWSTAELLIYLNQGQKEIAAFKPNASITNAAVQLVAGTKQSLPSGGLILIDVVRNMGAAGTTAGNAIRIVSRGILDIQVPNWHSATASGVVKHFMYTPLDPKRFYVYPPQPASPHYVEIIYGKTPTDCASTSSAIDVDDIYGPALHNYMVYRAYSKDAEVAANAQLASSYYSAFTQQMLGKAQGEQVAAPVKGAA